MKSVCLQFSLAILLCLCASLPICAQDYERGFFRMSPSASRLVPPVIANQGQFGEAVRFIIPGPSGTVIFTRDSVIVVLKQKTADSAPSPKDALTSMLPSEVREAALSRRKPIEPAQPAEVIRISFVDPDPGAKIEGTDEQPAVANRLVGDDSSKWMKGVAVFKGVTYHNLWPGVDLIFGADPDRITCALRVSEGADSTRAKVKCTGAETLEPHEIGGPASKALGDGWTLQRGLRTMIDRQGIFVAGTVYTPRGTALDKPSDYDADCFALRADYLSGRPSWITFIGGSADDAANAVCVDRHGYVYVNGYTQSGNFPLAGDAYRKEHNGHQDYFTARLTPSGGGLAYSTYLGVGGGGLGLEPFAAKWAPAFEGKREKLLAIMIDDGREEAQIKPFLDLGIPVTFAVMPWVDPTSLKQIKARGCAAFLHAPMEALGSLDRRGEEIMTTQTEKQVHELLKGWLALTPGVVGVSNHRGSAATSDPETMKRIATFATKHGLMVYDSNTAPVAVGANVCRDMNVPCLQQDFFLDERELSLMRARLLAMAGLAERTGYATCICHVGRPVVSDGIRSVIQELQARGFRFVTVPELYKALKGK